MLVAEVLRPRGRAPLGHPVLTLFVPDRMAGEAEYELRRRTRLIGETGRVSEAEAQQLLDLALAFLRTKTVPIAGQDYAPLEVEARRRIPRDSNDWPVVALALHLGGAAILTNDGDFLGCGLATWTSETLRA